MSSQDDCYFFFNSTCTKGDDCSFRHEPGALGNPVVCELWKNGMCDRNPCHSRHAFQETPKLRVPCFYENQPRGCLNYQCQYLHQKPRPFLGNYQFNHASQPPGDMRLPIPQPTSNALFPQRFAPPFMQPFRAPPRHRMEFSLGKMQPMSNYLPRLPVPDLRPSLFPNPIANARAPLPGTGFRDVRPKLFEQNASNNRSGFAMPNLDEQHLPFELRNTKNMPGGREIGYVNKQSGAMDNRRTSSGNPVGNDRRGFPGGTPVTPFTLGGTPSFNLFPQATLPKREKARPSGKSSSKRTVRKFESKRHHKSYSALKHHGERRTSQDQVDTRKRKKEKRSSSRDSSSRLRKERENTIVKKTRKSEHHSRDSSCVPKEVDKVVERKDEEIVGIKVKTLEEILRDKALKKLRERQRLKKTCGDDNHGRSDSSAQLERSDTPFSDVKGLDESADSKGSLLSQTARASKLDEKGKDLGNIETFAFGIDSAIPQSIADEPLRDCGSHENITNADSLKDVKSDLNSVKVKTLAELRQCKRTKLSASEESEDNSSRSKNVDLNKSKERKLKLLKPLRNTGMRKTSRLGSGNHSNKSSDGASCYQTSDEDPKKALAPLRGLTKTPVKSTPNKTVADKVLKRKLEPTITDKQQDTEAKIQSFTVGGKSEPNSTALQNVSKRTGTQDAISSKKETSAPAMNKKAEEENSEINNPLGRLSTTLVAKKKTEGNGSTISRKASRFLRFLENKNKNMTSLSTDKGKIVNEEQVKGTETRHSATVAKEGLFSRFMGGIKPVDSAESGHSRLTLSPDVEEQSGMVIEDKGKTTESVSEKNDFQSGEKAEECIVKGKENKTTDKPVKKIKLKRTGLLGSNSGNESEAKGERLGTTLGRKIKLNRAKLMKVTEAQNMTELGEVMATNRAEADASTNVKATPTDIDKEEPYNSSVQMEKSSVTTADTNSTRSADAEIMQKDRSNAMHSPTDIQDATRLSTLDASVAHPFTRIESITTDVALGPALSDNTTPVVSVSPHHCLTKATLDELQSNYDSRVGNRPNFSQTKIEVEESKDNPLSVKEEQFEQKKSLERLVKEVSDDMKDEDDDALDEALEKAIAEMSPVPTDDEDDVSNVDDLLLEIGEMMSS